VSKRAASLNKLARSRGLAANDGLTDTSDTTKERRGRDVDRNRSGTGK